MTRFTLVLFCFCQIALSSASVFAAGNRTLDEQMSHALANPKGADAEANAIEIFGMWDSAGAEATMAALEKLSGHKGASVRLRARAQYLLALGMVRLGQLTEAKAQVAKQGFVANWLVVGPFDNEGGTGFETEYAPESALTGPLFAATTMQGKTQRVGWRHAPAEVSNLGYTDLDPLFSPDVNICVYAATTIRAEKKGTGELRVGTGGAAKVFWNGAIVLTSDAYFRHDPDRLVAKVKINKGTNRLVVKVCKEESSELGVFARLTDHRATPWPEVPESDQLFAAAEAVRPGPRGKPLENPLDALNKLARKNSEDPDAASRAARYALMTGSIEASSTSARDFARIACIMDPTEANCTLWSRLAISEDEQREAFFRILERDADSVPATIAMAELNLNGLNPAKASSLIKKTLLWDAKNVKAELLRIRLLATRGFSRAAYARARTLHEKHPKSGNALDLAMRLAETSGHAREALALQEKMLEIRFDNAHCHKTLARAALARGDIEAMERHLDALGQLYPGDMGVHLLRAELLEGAGAIDEAQDSLALRTRIASRNPDAWKELGLFLLRNKKTEEGIRAVERASSLNPQDAWLNDYLALLKPRAPFEEPFVIPEDALLDMRTGRTDDHARYLVDQTVVQVADSGLSSTYRQVAVEIGTMDGARAWRRYPIQFTPTSQRVRVIEARVFRKDGTSGQSVARGTIPLSEPWYRLYYDIEAEILELPPMVPGDVLEIQYRVEDTSFRNKFGDYFGDFVFIDGELDKELWRYVLIAPKDRAYYTNEERLNDVTINLREDDETTIRVFEAVNLEKVAIEQGMPGPSSTYAHLHISTYSSWQDLGDWYAGLIRNQLVPDDKIRAKVKELVAGKRTLREKVGAIYQYVVTTTRYVGLEFGIHGYKPYPVPLIVSRGFGDCKDKASLLVAMFKEAGIDAEFILIRTSDLGYVEETPASLAVFNHAIAYVPALDLWLDGTAEHFGIHEIPFGDQDASVLRVRKGDSIFTRTPSSGTEQGLSVANVDVLLDPDGDANLTVEASVRGHNAALLRRNMEAEQTRDERFEAELAARYPGARLGKLDIQNLRDLTAPLDYAYTAFVPHFGRSSAGVIELKGDVGLGLAEGLGRLTRRKHSFVVGPKYAAKRSVTIHIPTGYKLDAAPSTAVIESPFGRLEYRVTVSGKKVEVERHFELLKHRISSDEYEAFVDFCKRVDDALDGRIVLTEGK